MRVLIYIIYNTFYFVHPLLKACTNFIMMSISNSKSNQNTLPMVRERANCQYDTSLQLQHLEAQPLPWACVVKILGTRISKVNPYPLFNSHGARYIKKNDLILSKYSRGSGNIFLQGCLFTHLQKFLGPFLSSCLCSIRSRSSKLGLSSSILYIFQLP